MATVDKPEFVLFLMNNDKFCMNFFTKLKTKPELMKKFNIVDIETIPAVPDEVDEIPAVYDGKQIFKGSEAFKWLNEKMLEYLSSANDGLMYSFIDGQEEQVFDKYSLIEQKNGSFGIGENGADPSRMNSLNDNSNKNRTLESVMASRNLDITNSGKTPPNLNVT
jgi:hypothetical protein